MKARRNQTFAARQALHEKIERSKQIKSEQPRKINANSMVFAGVLSGSTMNRVSIVLDACGVDHESLTKATSMLPGVEKKWKKKLMKVARMQEKKCLVVLPLIQDGVVKKMAQRLQLLG